MDDSELLNSLVFLFRNKYKNYDEILPLFDKLVGKSIVFRRGKTQFIAVEIVGSKRLELILEGKSLLNGVRHKIDLSKQRLIDIF